MHGEKKNTVAAKTSRPIGLRNAQQIAANSLRNHKLSNESRRWYPDCSLECRHLVRCAAAAESQGSMMTPLDQFTSDLQLLASWFTSVLAIPAILICVVIGVAFVEFIFKRGAIARAYTVKTDSSDTDVPSAGKRNAT
jgi:hypothetical protein